MKDLCPLCHGSGNLVTFSSGIEYWPCSVCHGAGVRVQYAPAVLSRKAPIRHPNTQGGGINVSINMQSARYERRNTYRLRPPFSITLTESRAHD